jgi:aurora kinase
VFALKVIRKTLINEFEMEDQLVREIKTQSMLQHPNIVKLFGTFYDEEKIYLVLEFCSDGELF